MEWSDILWIRDQNYAIDALISKIKGCLSSVTVDITRKKWQKHDTEGKLDLVIEKTCYIHYGKKSKPRRTKEWILNY